MRKMQGQKGGISAQAVVAHVHIRVHVHARDLRIEVHTVVDTTTGGIISIAAAREAEATRGIGTTATKILTPGDDTFLLCFGNS